MAWDRHVRPVGDQRLSRQLALIATIMANLYRGNKPAHVLDEFDLYPGTPPPRPKTRAEEEDEFRKQWHARGLVVIAGGKAT